jgi:hypothetical protein
MLYAILCYNREDVVFAWSAEQDAKVMADLAEVQARWIAKGKIGPTARLMPTSAATTLRKGDPPMVIDGPFAETKEQLLGFYLVNCDDLEEVLTLCRELGAVNPGGAYEVRPLHYFAANGGLPEDAVGARVAEATPA